MGCVNAPIVHSWGWQAGDPELPAPLQDTWCQSLHNVEQELRRQFDMVGGAKSKYAGRADGFSRRAGCSPGRVHGQGRHLRIGHCHAHLAGSIGHHLQGAAASGCRPGLSR
eukprot:3842833-Pyramimonas_sp.AAC.1